MISHKSDRHMPDKGASIMQMRPKAGEGSPEWYAPNRDLLHKLPKWLSQAMKRLETGETNELEAATKVSQGMATFINKVTRGDLAGKQEDVKALLTELKEDPEAYASISMAVMTHMLWLYWEFAGDVSLRKEGPLK